MRVNWRRTSCFEFEALTDPAKMPDGVHTSIVEVSAIKGDTPVTQAVQLENAQRIAEERIGPVALKLVRWADTTPSMSITQEAKDAAWLLCQQTGFPLAL